MQKFGLRRPVQIHQADDDDLYSGYEHNQTAANGGYDYALQAGTMRAPTSSGLMTSGGINVNNANGTVERPMTSVRGAGYNSGPPGTAQGQRPLFDTFKKGAGKGPAPPLQKRSEHSPELMARDMEKEVNTLLEESAIAAANSDHTLALEKAKEAAKKERALCRHREKNALQDAINYDLTYAVNFNLAHQLTNNGMHTEALDAYGLIVKNKSFPSAGRLRINMGNIYFQQKKYPAAIKMYRMALDNIGNNVSKTLRFKIMRNIGNAFIKLGQFPDAIQSFESIMENSPDPTSGYNLIVCYYALGDPEKMKKGFLQLLSLPQYLEDEEEVDADPSASSASPSSIDVVLPSLNKKEDDLKKEYIERQKEFIRLVRTAAKLIAPTLASDLSAGFDWVIEALKQPPTSPRNIEASRALGFNSNTPASSSSSNNQNSQHSLMYVAMEMEIAKGIAYLKRKEFAQAIEVFRNFERKEQALLDQAATNLSFLYFLEGDYKNAEKHAEFAVKADRYNAKALVNRANCLFVRGEFDSAKEIYLEAIGVEADCVEAIYNLGLVNKRLDNLGDALQAFKKLHRIVPKSTLVVYHIANLYELMNDQMQAAEWFKILHAAVPSDPKVLARLGNICSNEDDNTQAFHNYLDSYRYLPTNMEVITWLGVWYVKQEMYEQAIQFFQRAAEIEPQELKWQLMVASCYRRMGNFPQALQLYKDIHKLDPDNIECLRYLCTITKDMGDKNYEEYSKKLKKAERMLESKESQFYRDDVPQGAMSHDGYGSTSPSGGPGTPPSMYIPPLNTSSLGNNGLGGASMPSASDSARSSLGSSSGNVGALLAAASNPAFGGTKLTSRIGSAGSGNHFGDDDDADDDVGDLLPL